jgi:drug/metabolite transporter (DMT)-like permease
MMNNKSEMMAYIMLILATSFWAGNFIVGKVATLFEIPPITLNFYRWFVAWIILAPFTMREVLKSRLIIKENLLSIIIMSFTSISVFNSVVYYGLNYTQVLNGVLMISTIPILIIIITSIFKTEKVNIYQIAGVSVSLLGVIVIITKMEFQRLIHLQLNKGDLWILVAMLSWATYSIIIKEKKINLRPFVLLQTLITFGVILLAPIYFLEVVSGKYLPLNLPVFLTIGYVVLFAGIGAYIFWNGAVMIIGANRAGVFLHLMPVFSSIMAITLLGESFSKFHFFGAVFIVLGIFLSSKKVLK